MHPQIQEQFDTELYEIPWNFILCKEKISAEVSSLIAFLSKDKKAEEDLVALNWYNYNKPKVGTPQNPSRQLLGTMLIWWEYKNQAKPFCYVFEIWGDQINEKQVFARMVSHCNSYYTYSKYTWKRGQSARQVTQGWDLRDYESKGTYFTNGVEVH